MANLHFNCPHCQQPLDVPQEMLGQEGECPRCNGAMRLPSPAPVAFSPAAPRVVHPSRQQPAYHKPTQESAGVGAASRRILLWPGVAGFVVCVGLYLGSPFWSVWRLGRAVEANDAVAIADRVDFPRLRESLKAVIKAEVVREFVKDPQGGVDALGKMLGSMMLDGFVEAFVTPEGVSAMMRGKDIDEILPGKEDSGAEEKRQSAVTPPKIQITRMGYERLGRFVVEVADPQSEQSKDRVTLIFERSAVVIWKLAGVRLQAN